MRGTINRLTRARPKSSLPIYDNSDASSPVQLRLHKGRKNNLLLKVRIERVTLGGSKHGKHSAFNDIISDIVLGIINTLHVAALQLLLPRSYCFQIGLLFRSSLIGLSCILSFADRLRGGLKLASYLSVGSYDLITIYADIPLLDGPSGGLLIQHYSSTFTLG